ncbi:YbaK/EbsC family protein [Vibrio hepatarius]|jgi:Ala-tRNA(Pro) deacylase|uniref:DNA-binding protein n=1 Tax=Vibrio hepatarius TaxID=171383 RepID=A0A0M0I163_9VIBR|nr:YbaK/EbsC family protein [Vibrio hepatarius]KOO08051.1 DNA-binding protein [Vibrio hepatarius]
MDKLEKIYRFNTELLNQLDIPFNEWTHEPILDFETDVKVARELGWTGTHSKSLFLKLKPSGYALYITDKDSRLDSKAIKQITGKRVSIVGNDEMTEQTGCVPGAVCPFGLPDDITIFVDSRLYQHDEILYTPGHPERTIGFTGSELSRILSSLPNPYYEI